MPNKIEVARFLSERFPWLSPWVGTMIWWGIAALATYRLTMVVRYGSRTLDLFVVPVGMALLGDLILNRWLHDDVTWMGAGLGLVAGALATRTADTQQP